MHYVMDIDDTLYLERDYVRSGFQAVDLWLDRNIGYENFFEAAWKLFESGETERIFDRVLGEKICRDNGLIEKMVECYRTHKPEIHLLADAGEFIARCGKKRLSIITDGCSAGQWNKIRALNLEPAVDRIIVTDDWGRDYWKPHQRAFKAAMENRAAAQCCYIADNPEKDFIAPSELEWTPSFRIRRKGSLHENAESPGGCREINDFSEIKTE